ncbi:MAG TPA: cyclic nucleotide-binding domain-containing protein [Candidatus Limnocylindria bacterium]|jgi:CRP-like cAMP-binding protein
MRSAPDDISDTLAGLAIFADLTRPELERVAHTLEERYFAENERVLREGLSGSGFYLILEGEAVVVAAGKRISTLARGEFFGEISVLLGEAPVADIVATRPLRCLVLPGGLLHEFLLANPRVCYRILVAEARKLAQATRRGG